MHVLSVSSLKGGVGKTTVTLGLTSAAFARGLSTLVVDIDPQSDVSTGLDVSVEGRLNIADVLASPKEKVVRSAIAPSGWTRGRPGKVDVLIGSPSAINFDGPHPSIRDIWKLEEALAHVESEYDLVLIDCAPSLNALTRTAWAASDRVTVVTEPGLFSVAAADRALRAIEEIRRGLSPRLQPLGIIVNRVRTQSLEHQFRIKELRDMFGPLVLSPQLPERTSLQQTQGAAKPLHMWPGESAKDMADNFDQLLDRVIRAGHIPVATTTPEEPRDELRGMPNADSGAQVPQFGSQQQFIPQQQQFAGQPGPLPTQPPQGQPQAPYFPQPQPQFPQPQPQFPQPEPQPQFQQPQPQFPQAQPQPQFPQQYSGEQPRVEPQQPPQQFRSRQRETAQDSEVEQEKPSGFPFQF